MRKSSNGKSNDVFYIVYNTKKNQKKDIPKKNPKHPKTWISKSALGKGIYLLVYMYMYD